MKILSLLVILSLCFSVFTLHSFSQSCLPEGITFNTQEQIDNFQVNYPGCTEIEGYVEISGEDITNLNGLNVLTSLGDYVGIIWNNSLVNLSGLDNVTDIGGSFILHGDVLINLTGLESLTTILGDFEIGGNSITSLSGLESLNTIGGSLKIASCDALINLTGLENLNTVGGSFIIGWYAGGGGNDNLTSLNGLENLNSIGWNLGIYGNSALISLSGLDNLISIGGNLEIKNNPIITLTAFDNLTSIGGSLKIEHNYNLINLSGLDNIDPGSIGNLHINNNSSLSYCDVQSVCDYLVAPNGNVTIQDNADGCSSVFEIAENCSISMPCLPFGDYYIGSQADIDNFQAIFPGCNELNGSMIIEGEDITNLIGLNNIISLEGYLSIAENPGLVNLTGLNNLNSIEESFLIGGNTMLTNLTGLENLTTIGGDFEIGNNDYLTSLIGLENLTLSGYLLWIHENTSLTSLSGLDNLTIIGGSYGMGVIDIEWNDALVNLIGLENINSGSIGNLYISDNSSLSYCNVQSICEYLSAPNGSGNVTIQDNAPGCNSPEEVEEDCLTDVQELSFDNFFTITPNPISSASIIEYTIQHNSPVSLQVLDISGQVVTTLINNYQQGDQKILFDASELNAGVYFCTLKTNKGIQTKKIVKL